MKGWVYIISNRSMPGLIKVGCTGQDPELRAEGLGGTHSPHPYKVEYEILIEQPEKIEGLAHRALSEYREGKEWFRCTVEKGIAAVKQVAGDLIINETFKHADRKKSEELQTQEDENRKRERILRQKEKEINDKYEKSMELKFPKRAFDWFWWFCISTILMFCSLPFMPVGWNILKQMFICSIGGALFAYFLKTYLEHRDKRSKEYNLLITARDEELKNVTID